MIKSLYVVPDWFLVRVLIASIPQLFQKIACWTQNCYYDVLGLYLNAVFLVTSHFFPLPHNAT